MSRKIVITLFLIAAIIGSAVAQDAQLKQYAQGHKWGVNLGAEMNMNSGDQPELNNKTALGFGAHIGGEYNINDMFAAGINMNFNFSDFFAFEAAALFRWYFLSGLPDSAGIFRNIFAQADLGVWTGTDSHSEAVKFLGGGSLGMRLPLPGNFYIEPYARFGYPFLAGGGVSAGFLF